ncbi:MAG: YebC/PmpR family DNA-binding transcriptional regulator [Anaerolineales bacterium]|nr:YebC/PmpR family DNA-binding transcriptional regulator [Anaerolineales bacterium]
MSGHSKWSTIKRKKGANDAKRGQIFTRLGREIMLAARDGGEDPESNFRLRLAIDRARAQNMPKDNIERAIKRGAGGKEGVDLVEVMYEGYGPNGVALIIECVTDNRNRTVAEIRHILTRHGGNLGEGGSVAWQFNRVAVFTIPTMSVDQDKVFELAVEAEADDVKFDEDSIEIIGPVEAFKHISKSLRQANIQPEEAGLKMLPNNELELDPQDAMQVMRVVEALEDLDDVQEVYSNLNITDEVLAQLEAA